MMCSTQSADRRLARSTRCGPSSTRAAEACTTAAAATSRAASTSPRSSTSTPTDTFKSADALRAAFAPALGKPQVITYCGGGIAATSVALVLAMLGYDQVKVYDNSLTEWAADPALPMETGA